MFLFIFEREIQRDRAWAGEGQRDRDRIWSTLWAPSCQHRAPCGAWTCEQWNHDLSRSQMLNQLATQAPIICFVFQIPHAGETIWYLPFSVWLISLRIMSSKSIHVVANGKISFFSMVNNIPVYTMERMEKIYILKLKIHTYINIYVFLHPFICLNGH